MPWRKRQDYYPLSIHLLSLMILNYLWVHFEQCEQYGKYHRPHEESDNTEEI
ncbi:MAG: hypothetical protein UY31_C0070G0003 [Candidatus Wolfebacteria bacterium GW2011_GWE1_48_7]|nr:MAG: hypothetical protein UY31_C0070G0003 [Candidatus Wolfebacteria bacterium GW2011_GWE1_48_7]